MAIQPLLRQFASGEPERIGRRVGAVVAPALPVRVRDYGGGRGGAAWVGEADEAWGGVESGCGVRV